MAGQIREVWADNLEMEMAHLRKVIEKYQYIAMVGTTVWTEESFIFLSRTQNSLVSSLDLLVHSKDLPTIRTRLFDVTSTF